MLNHLRRWTAALLLGVALAPAALGVNSGRVEYYHRDALGNVRVVTDETGQVLERHDYLPFGEECTTGACATNPGVASGQPRRFTGKERDSETGLDSFGARYYAQHVGRFIAIDPVFTWRENLLDPQRWNRYAYGRNNPLRYVDPDGRATLPAMIPLMTTAQPIGQDNTRLDTAIGMVSGVLTTLVPGLEIQANSSAQAQGQIVGQFLALGTGVGLSSGARAPTGLQVNKAAGDAWSRAVGAELQATYEIAVPEITVRTQTGARTRLDWVTRDGSGTIRCIECKASSSAPLTRGQAAAHPEIAQTGALVVGKGKPGVPGGTAIPPTRVEVRRPK